MTLTFRDELKVFAFLSDLCVGLLLLVFFKVFMIEFLFLEIKCFFIGYVSIKFFIYCKFLFSRFARLFGIGISS